MYDFTPLSEIQKLFTFHPLKTYRLFTRFRRQGKLKEVSDWILRDGQILVRLPQFLVELESVGYRNILREDFTEFHEISNSDHLKSDSVQMKSDENHGFQNENVPDEFKPPNQPPMQEDEIKQNEMISNDTQVKSNENNPISPDFIRVKDEIIHAKDEIIEVLKTSLGQAQKRIEHLEGSADSLVEQNQRLTTLTYMLMAPKENERANQSAEYADVRTVEPKEAQPTTPVHTENQSPEKSQADELSYSTPEVNSSPEGFTSYHQP